VRDGRQPSEYRPTCCYPVSNFGDRVLVDLARPRRAEVRRAGDTAMAWVEKGFVLFLDKVVITEAVLIVAGGGVMRLPGSRCLSPLRCPVPSSIATSDLVPASTQRRHSGRRETPMTNHHPVVTCRRNGAEHPRRARSR
jgi:hypothetical protein